MKNDMKRLKSKGLSLVELMVAIVIGMLVTLAVMNLFLTNTRTHKTTENLSRVQENARMAFELMATDLRQAGGSPCGDVGVDIPLMNMLNDPDGDAGWSLPGIRGYESAEDLPGVAFGTSAGRRVSGTDAVTYGYASTLGAAIAEIPANPSADLKLTENPGLTNDDIVMVCDVNQAHIFQITNVSGGGTGINVVHNTGQSTPGNDSKCFWLGSGDTSDIGGNCPNTFGTTVHAYDKNSFITKYNSVAWYLGCNGRVACSSVGGRSLYNVVFPGVAQEVVPDVQNMQMSYLLNGAYVDASAVTTANWSNVKSVRITLTLLGPDAGATTSTNSQDRLTRTISHVVGLRNQINE